MLKIFNYNNQNSANSLKILLDRRKLTQKNLTSTVNKIIKNVRRDGDRAVLSYEKKFSKLRSKSNKVFFTKKEINKISKKTNKNIKKSIDLAYKRIKRFHTRQKFSSFKLKDKYNNELSYKYTPINKIGDMYQVEQQVILALF